MQNKKLRLSRLGYLALLLVWLVGILAACAPASGPLVSGTNGMPWWNDTVFYEIFVRSFADSNGDGIGDFKGITQKLDYLADLGVKGLWLMPINPASSYHGYDVTDYYTVNPDYGTLDDFKNLLKEAHARGIRIILDLVINHTSSQHPWFQSALDPASKYRNWYIWSETNPGYMGPWGGQVWHRALGGFYYYGVFIDGMPDLNYGNPEVTQEMNKVVKFWLDLGLDGYRLDGAKHLVEEGSKQENTQATLDWFKLFKQEYKKINPQAITVGEIWSSSSDVARYISEGGMDLAFNFDLASAWVDNVRAGRADKLMFVLLTQNEIFPKGQYATFLTNHDMNRAQTQFAGSLAAAKSAATIYLTAPGVPFLYYGEEIGMEGAKPDEKIRLPMQWGAGSNAGFSTVSPWMAPNADYLQKNVEMEAKDPDSLLNLYKKLIQARNQHEALRVGDLVKVSTGNERVYGMLRTTAKEAVLTLVNLSNEPIRDYQLSFTSATLKGSYTPQALVGTGGFAGLQLDAQGGVEGYKPLAELPGNANLVLLLGPAK